MSAAHKTVKAASVIIPPWGTVYAQELTSMTLAGLLAPGNLPVLCTIFDLEMVIVTKTTLLDAGKRHPRLPARCVEIVPYSPTFQKPANSVGSQRDK